MAGSLTRDRLYTIVLVVFAASALAITAVGLFGVLSYTVAQRAREIALRAALGATPGQAFGLILGQGLAATLVGLAAGSAIAVASSRFLTTMLYGVSSHDAVTFIVVAVVILLVALAACLVPAVRAVRISPLDALKTP